MFDRISRLTFSLGVLLLTAAKVYYQGLLKHRDSRYHTQFQNKLYGEKNTTQDDLPCINLVNRDRRYFLSTPPSVSWVAKVTYRQVNGMLVKPAR